MASKGAWANPRSMGVERMSSFEGANQAWVYVVWHQEDASVGGLKVYGLGLYVLGSVCGIWCR